MSRQLNNVRESRAHVNLRDFTNSVDIKRFSRERGNMTPLHQAAPGGLFKKIYERSNEKIRNTQPTSLAVTFSKHISHKNMETKRKLSSGNPRDVRDAPRSHHHSVSIDQHLIREKFAAAKELFELGKHDRLVAVARHILPHFDHSQAQRTLYYWLGVSLLHLRRDQEAAELMAECLAAYTDFQEGYLCLAAAYRRLRRLRMAADNYLRAVRLDPAHPAAYLPLALTYQAMRDHTAAAATAQQALTRFPNDPDLLIVLVESLLAAGGGVRAAEAAVRAAEEGGGRRESGVLYAKGLVARARGEEGEACMLFEEAVKFNSSRAGVAKALLETIKLEVERRDFYQAHHSLGRMKLLEVEETEEVRVYGVFVEGVMAMMKKKSEEALRVLGQLAAHARTCDGLRLTPLLNKYLAYGYFKLSQFANCIAHYLKLAPADLDPSSHYNLLLAQGIDLADRLHRFPEATAKFAQAKAVYPQKVEPYIYIAMTAILQRNCAPDRDDAKLAEALIAALRELEAGNRLNPNSSNLLYHRTIIHLYFEDWEEAHADINRCIEKAEENLPKYFYLRGVCHTCVRDFKKAINEFSICLSLEASFAEAHLEKAKCYFLLGNTEKGFGSLKQFMELSPDDLTIYKWIGDLLYEGMSYADALKAYAELGPADDLDTLVMKLKCTFRVGSLNEATALLRAVEKHPGARAEKVAVDGAALTLLGQLAKQEHKNLGALVKKINKSLEENVVGYLFQLVDCMNLMGVASFYAHRFTDAYESFLLVLELHHSLEDKQAFSLKSEATEEHRNLRLDDIYANIIACELAQGNHEEALRMASEDLLPAISEPRRRKVVETFLREWAGEGALEWDLRVDKPFNSRLKRLELNHPRLALKAKATFNLYHDSATHLYSSTVAEKMVSKLHAGYIDNMPEGPWIRRNPYGVVFTEEVMPADASISFEDTPRLDSSRLQQQSGEEEAEGGEEEKKTISKREEFLKKLKFDEGVEAKLNSMIQKAQEGKKQ